MNPKASVLVSSFIHLFAQAPSKLPPLLISPRVRFFLHIETQLNATNKSNGKKHTVCTTAACMSIVMTAAVVVGLVPIGLVFCAGLVC